MLAQIGLLHFLESFVISVRRISSPFCDDSLSINASFKLCSLPGVFCVLISEVEPCFVVSFFIFTLCVLLRTVSFNISMCATRKCTICEIVATGHGPMTWPKFLFVPTWTSIDSNPSNSKFTVSRLASVQNRLLKTAVTQ